MQTHLTMPRFNRPTLAAACALLSSAACGQIAFPAGSSLDVPTGSDFDFGCERIEIGGTANLNGRLGGSELAIGSTGVFNGGTGTLELQGNFSNDGTFNAGTGTVRLMDGCGGTGATIKGNTVFNNLVLASTSGGTFVVPSGSSITVNGTLTLQGVMGQPIHVVSSGSGLAVLNLGPSAQVVDSGSALSNVRIGPDALPSTPAPPPAVTSIPTLNEYGSALLLLVTVWFGMRSVRRSRRALMR